MDIGNRVRIQYHYGDKMVVEGVIDRRIEGDIDGGGFWMKTDDGEELEVLFQDLFRKDATLEYKP